MALCSFGCGVQIVQKIAEGDPAAGARRGGSTAEAQLGSMASGGGGAAGAPAIREVLPKAGLVYSEKGNLAEVLCKPKLLPIKSAVLEKLERLEKEATAGLAAAAGAASAAPPRTAAGGR